MENEATFEMVAQDTAPGDSFAAKFLATGGDTAQMRTLSVLREDEWRLFDEAVVQIARDRFTMVNDFRSAGLTFPVSNPLAVTQLSWDRVSDMNDAIMDMTMEAPENNDRVDFLQESMPIPIIHKGFNLNLRTLMSSRRNGTPLDTIQVEVATRKVVERIEQLFITGSYATGSPAGTIYGATTHPQRNTYTSLKDWTDSDNVSGVGILDDIFSMMALAEADNMFGPYALYVPKDYMQRLREDYQGDSDTARSGQTIAERIAQIDGISFVRQNQFMPADEAILVQLTRDVVDIIDGIQPRVVEWQNQGDMITNYKVMAIVLPRWKRDYDNRSGLVHATAE